VGEFWLKRLRIRKGRKGSVKRFTELPGLKIVKLNSNRVKSGLSGSPAPGFISPDIPSKTFEHNLFQQAGG
jgi:16S rRNA U516 pseudouridylate synthase RsuA-like enzyme